MDHELIEAALDKIRPGWRERRERRKSPWNLFGVVISFGVAGVAWYGLFCAAWRFHVEFHPSHAGQMEHFWPAGLSFRSFESSLAMLLPLAVPALTVGLLMSNLVLWCVPSARRALNAEAGDDPEMTFAGANRGLIKWGGIVSAISLVIAAVGAATLSSLR